MCGRESRGGGVCVCACVSDGIPACLAPPVKLNRRQSLAHFGGLSSSSVCLSHWLWEHQQPPGWEKQVRSYISLFSGSCLTNFRRVIFFTTVLQLLKSIFKLYNKNLNLLLCVYQALTLTWRVLFTSYLCWKSNTCWVFTQVWLDERTDLMTDACCWSCSCESPMCTE